MLRDNSDGYRLVAGPLRDDPVLVAASGVADLVAAGQAAAALPCQRGAAPGTRTADSSA